MMMEIDKENPLNFYSRRGESVSHSDSSAEPAQKQPRIQKPKKQPFAKGPRSKTYQNRRDRHMYNLSGAHSHYGSRTCGRTSTDQQVMIFYDAASYETKECNVESPFYFEVSEQDMYLSEQTSVSLHNLYESIKSESEIRDYLQVVAASCDRYMLLQQQNVNDFYKQLELSRQSTPMPVEEC